MTRFNFDILGSYVIAGLVSLYASLLLLAATTPSGTHIGSLII